MRPQKKSVNLGQSGPSRIYQKISPISNLNTQNNHNSSTEDSHKKEFFDGGLQSLKDFTRVLDKFIYQILHNDISSS